MIPTRFLAFASALAIPAAALASQQTQKPHVPHKPAHRTAKADLKLHRRWARPVHAQGKAGSTVGPLAVNETEHNGTVGWADAFAGQPDYEGNIAFAGDLDVVELQVLVDSVVLFDVSQAGTSPIADPTLLIRDAAGQFVAYNDDRSGSLMPLINIPLPRGTYHCEMAGYAANTGTYKLTTTVTPTVFANANLGVPVTGTVPPGGEVAFACSSRPMPASA